MSARDAAGSALPEFTVRRSARARRVRLTVTPRDGLVVTLPPGVPHAAAADAVRAKRAWADGALARVAQRRAELAAGPDALVPHAVALRAVGRVLPVEYRATSRASAHARAVERGTLLVVSGDIDDAEACLHALRRWRDRAARRYLPPLLETYAAGLGVQPARVTVRLQRSRWGSCSSAGNISLNGNLLFLPPELTQLVMVHELAHLRHRDHSGRFYDLLETWYPGASSLRAEFREAWEYVPAWAMA